MAHVVVVEDHGGGPLTAWMSTVSPIRPATDGFGTDVDSICNALLERIAKLNPDVIIVTADWKPHPDASRFDQHGVTLLKHLRLGLALDPIADGIRHTHVVICAWERPDELIRRKPGNILLLSDGVTFLRLPDGLSKVADAAFLEARGGKPATISRDYLHPFVACDYHPRDPAHDQSNLWGVRLVSQATISLGGEVRAITEDTSRVLRSLEMKEGLFLSEDQWYGHKVSSEVRDNWNLARLTIEEAAEAIHDIRVRRGVKGERPIHRPRILLLDDKIEWQSVLGDALFRNPKSRGNVRAVTGTPPGAAEVLDVVGEFDPDVVLLDLRMCSKDHRVPVDKTSGAQLLGAIRQFDLGLPVVLLTASNKYWTYRELTHLGCDGFWMKPGLGEHSPPVCGEEHLLDLLEIVKNCLNKYYTKFREFCRLVEMISQQQEPWWKEMDWRIRTDDRVNDERFWAMLGSTHPSTNRVCDQVRNALSMTRSYLRSDVVDPLSEEAKQEHRNAIVMATGKIVEQVHDFGTFKRSTGQVPNRAIVGGSGTYSYRSRGGEVKLKGISRGDDCGAAFLKMRNDSAHAEGAPPTNDEVFNFLGLVLCYLNRKPQPGRQPHVEYLKDFRRLTGHEPSAIV